MSKFEKYFLMKSDDIVEYVKEKLDFFEKDAKLSSEEIGDGNLNYVFKVCDKENQKSIIVKHAGEELRISKEMKMPTDRTRIEYEILLLQNKLTKGLVPKVYMYDNIMNCLVMEDLSDYSIMRKALMNHEKFPKFAEIITDFIVKTLILTSDIYLPHNDKKREVVNFMNPELCVITEDLVYTEPYNDCNNRNNVFKPIEDFVKKELYEDKNLHLAVAKCKFEFMNNPQSLIHGDLHTGSIFVKGDSVKVFDPEFACYAPMGYDIGNIIANLIFSWINANATIVNEKEKDEFKLWAETTISDIVDLFKTKFSKAFKENVTDLMAKTEGFMEYYLGNILKDTAAVVGLEMIRRTVGMANVKDITSIPDENKRIVAEKFSILFGKDMILNSESFSSGKDYINKLKTIENKLK